jgi:hypothetical protein
MTLYKNGAAESLDAFNDTLYIYTAELHTSLGEKEALVLALLISMFAVITMFFVFIALPMFIRLNSIRKTYWMELFARFKTHGRSI